MPTPKSFVEDAPKSFVPDESPQSTAPTVTPTPGAVLRPLTERERFTMTYPVGVKGEGVGENLHNMAQNAGVGIFQGVDALVHPVRTLEGIAASIIPQPVFDWSKNQGREGELRKKRDRGEELSKDEQEYLRKAEGFEGAQNPIQQVGEGMQRPGEFLPNAAGQALVFDAAGRLLGPGASALKETSKEFREGMTGTGPRVTKELSAKTAEENAKNATRTENLNAKRAEVDTARAGKVEKSNDEALKAHDTAIAEADKKNLAEHVKHLAEKSQIERANQEAAAVSRADEATSDLVKARTEEMDARVENKRHDALKEGNKLYKEPNEVLGPLEANAKAVQKATLAARQTLKGSDTKLPIVDQIEAKLRDRKGPLVYKDVAGFITELGAETGKGGLAGDVFKAYDNLHEALQEEAKTLAIEYDADHGMQATVRKKIQTPEQYKEHPEGEYETIPHPDGIAAKVDAARSFWRRMKQTFGKSSDVINNRAGKAVNEANPDYIDEQENDYRLRLLGSFDPEITKLAAEIKDATSKLKAPASEKVKPVPEAPKPVEVNPPDTKPVPKPRQPLETPVKKVELEDIRQAKGESAAKKETKARTGYAPIVSTGLFVDALRSAMQGQWEHAGVDVAARGLYEIGKQTYAALLRNPDVIRVITEPTARDIAQIPPELRGESLKGLIEQAKYQGIKVDPRISALAGASAVGPRTQELQKMRSQIIR